MRRRPASWEAYAALLLASATMLLAAWLFKLNHDQGQDIKDALSKIQESRVVLSRQSCRQRNNERAVQRANLHQSLEQLGRVSDEALAQLGFTRAEAVAQVRKQLRQVAPLDCKRLVRQVARSNASASSGGGSGSSQGARRPPRRAGSRSERPADQGGGSDTVVPESPPEPGGGRQTPRPVPGGGEGGVPNERPPAGPAGGLVDQASKTGQQAVDDVQGLIDGVQQTVDDVAGGLVGPPP